MIGKISKRNTYKKGTWPRRAVDEVTVSVPSCIKIGLVGIKHILNTCREFYILLNFV